MMAWTKLRVAGEALLHHRCLLQSIAAWPFHSCIGREEEGQWSDFSPRRDGR